MTKTNDAIDERLYFAFVLQDFILITQNSFVEITHEHLSSNVVSILNYHHKHISY
jgi:hypothetical protein